MAVILFVDLLGARAKWRKGGIDASIEMFDRFTAFMIAAARPQIDCVLDGGIETDAAAFVCTDALSALRIARVAFGRAFRSPRSNDGTYLWLRGALVESDGSSLRTTRPAWGNANKVQIVRYGRQFFDAVSVEKSGFKGMRLLVRKNVLTKDVRDALTTRVGSKYFVPVKRLQHSTYPAGPSEDLQDYLWMHDVDADSTWPRASLDMSRRLRDTAADPEEFAQAAATQLLFHEYVAIHKSVQSRSRRAGKR